MNEEVKSAYETFLVTVNDLSISEKSKCNLIMSMANVVAVISRQENPFTQGAHFHSATKEYAIKYAQLSGNPMIKMLSSMFLEDK